MILADTIVAVATPHGFGGISVIRISGPDSKNIAKKISLTNKNKARFRHQSVTLVKIINSDGLPFEEGVITFFKKKGSKPKDLIAVVGPAISVKNYEIKKDFLKKFLNKNKKNKIYFKFFHNKIFFDLRKYIFFQMRPSEKYVLSPFPEEYKEEIDLVINKSRDGLEYLLDNGITKTMNKFN